jgi:hypothetical protein
MIRKAFLLALLPAASQAASARHFDVTATFAPAHKAGGSAAVVVTFRPLDPDVRVNETPAPHLKLDLTQTVLVDRQPPASGQAPDYDPLSAKYLDTARPVSFPVGIAPTAPKGAHEVKASVIFFYCSTREAWCRRGTADVLISAINVP